MWLLRDSGICSRLLHAVHILKQVVTGQNPNRIANMIPGGIEYTSLNVMSDVTRIMSAISFQPTCSSDACCSYLLSARMSDAHRIYAPERRKTTLRSLLFSIQLTCDSDPMMRKVSVRSTTQVLRAGLDASVRQPQTSTRAARWRETRTVSLLLLHLNSSREREDRAGVQQPTWNDEWNFLPGYKVSHSLRDIHPRFPSTRNIYALSIFS